MTFKTKIDKMAIMNQKKLDNLSYLKEIADVTGTSSDNVARVYIRGKKALKKTKMLQALNYGTYLIEYTPEEIIFAKKVIEAMRETHSDK